MFCHVLLITSEDTMYLADKERETGNDDDVEAGIFLDWTQRQFHCRGLVDKRLLLGAYLGKLYRKFKTAKPHQITMIEAA